jgi:hypothetical protein
MSTNDEALHLPTRREAIRRVGALFGGVALVGETRLLEALARPISVSEPVTSVLGVAEVALLEEVADALLPETSTPGAKAAGVGPFMALMVADAYDPEEQRIFADGLRSLERECTEMHGHGFMTAAPVERLSLLERLDREQYDYMQARERRLDTHPDADEPVHYFRMMKELALLGYFTSEIGYKQALRFIETPGRYEPCVPYKPGDRAWAGHA